MISFNGSLAPSASRAAGASDEGSGLGPALVGGWIGGTLLAAAAFHAGLGWLAVLAAYGFGGAILIAAFAVVPHIEFNLNVPALRLAPVRQRARR